MSTDGPLSTTDSAEKQIYAGAARMSAWMVVIEGNSAADVRGAHEALATGLQVHNAGAFESAIYRLDLTRLKSPWSAG
jgi:hypothetical protein